MYVLSIIRTKKSSCAETELLLKTSEEKNESIELCTTTWNEMLAKNICIYML